MYRRGVVIPQSIGYLLKTPRPPRRFCRGGRAILLIFVLLLYRYSIYISKIIRTFVHLEI